MDASEQIKRKKAFLQTITFFDIFDFALTRDEICDYMLYKKWTPAELKDFTNHESFVVETNSHVYLKGRALSVKVREDKEYYSRKLVKKAEKYVRFMQFLPFVRMVALCNNLSFYNSAKGSDIDIFVVTEKNRMFFARSMVWIFSQLLGLRRHGNKTRGRFCLTFFVSKDAMNLEPIKREKDIYFVFWLRLLRPIIGYETYRELMAENQWINEYFDYEIDNKKHLLPESKVMRKIQKVLEFLFDGIIGNGIEWLMKKWQIKRSVKKASKLESRDGIIISENVLKFHNEDMREKYHSLWEGRFAQFEQFLEETIPSDYDKQFVPQFHQIQTPFEARSQRSVDKRSETQPRHSQKEQIPAD